MTIPATQKAETVKADVVIKALNQVIEHLEQNRDKEYSVSIEFHNSQNQEPAVHEDEYIKITSELSSINIDIQVHNT